ncbi:MAG: flagellar hook-basal body complex protein FliE [Verrucomicrobia bacterium]|nr:flagellar hook-basal body complex protein FliE [Verrucomicrobiota bacterium]
MTPITNSFSSNLAAAWARPTMAKSAGTASSVAGETSVAAPGSRFGDMLSEMVQKTDASQKTSAATTGAMLSGQNVPLHQVMISSEEASISFQLMLEVRNKLLDGYQELMRMQV